MKLLTLFLLLSSSLYTMESTKLLIAVRDGDNDLILQLVEEGADINSTVVLKSKEKSTALIEACKIKHQAMILFLIRQGADVPRLSHERGMSAISYAATRKDTDTCVLLLLWKLFSDADSALAKEVQLCVSLREVRQRLFKNPKSEALKSLSSERMLEKIVDCTWEGAQEVCAELRKTKIRGGHKAVEILCYKAPYKLKYLLHSSKLTNFRDVWMNYLTSTKFSKVD